jgi:hypothetical protein
LRVAGRAQPVAFGDELGGFACHSQRPSTSRIE